MLGRGVFKGVQVERRWVYNFLLFILSLSRQRRRGRRAPGGSAKAIGWAGSRGRCRWRGRRNDREHRELGGYEGCNTATRVCDEVLQCLRLVLSSCGRGSDSIFPVCRATLWGSGCPWRLPGWRSTTASRTSCGPTSTKTATTSSRRRSATCAKVARLFHSSFITHWNVRHHTCRWMSVMDV